MPDRKKPYRQPAHKVRPGISATSAWSLRVLAGITIIASAAFLAYLPCLNGGFILDDDDLLTTNRLIKDSYGLYRFWTTEAIDYWPVTNTTLWLEWRLWGMNASGYHVTNLLLHIASGLLLWLVLRQLSIPGAFLAALIFTVHPVNVESVAWISSRKNLLAILFFLLSILWYLKADAQSLPEQNPPYRSDKSRWYWLSLAAFLLAMLSKGSVAVLPALLLGIIWWQRPLTRWDFVRMAPFFLVALVLALVNVWFQKHGVDVVIRSAGFTERLLGAGSAIWFYLYKALLPFDLALIYPPWKIKVDDLLWWLPLLGALTVTAVLWWCRESWSRPLLFAWGFFCVSLVPVLGFTDVGFMKYSLVADRYQHIAIIGLIALATAGWSVWRDRALPAARHTANALAITAAGTLMFLTWQHSALYSDAMKLYQAALKKYPDCWMTHSNLGMILDDLGRYDDAVAHYRRALQIKPDYPEAQNNLGVTLYKMGRPAEAIASFRKALQFKEDYPAALNNLGFTLIQTGKSQEAIEYLEQALNLSANYPDAHNNLGKAFFKAGGMKEAIEHFQQALRLGLKDADTYCNLGVAWHKTGQPQKAIGQYQQALGLKPNFPEAQNNLGVALVEIGRPQEAIRYYQQAIRLKPDYIESCFNLAIAFAQTSRPNDALAAAQKGLTIARSQGQTTWIIRLENWLKSYRARLSSPSNTPPSHNSPSAPQ